MRPKSDFTKVKMNYNIVAPRMYKGKIESLVSRITGFADMIQLNAFKTYNKYYHAWYQMVFI